MGTLVPQGAKLFISKVWLADSAALIGEGYRTSTETEDHNLYYLGIVAPTPSGAEFGPTFTHYNLGNETVPTFPTRSHTALMENTMRVNLMKSDFPKILHFTPEYPSIYITLTGDFYYITVIYCVFTFI